MVKRDSWRIIKPVSIFMLEFADRFGRIYAMVMCGLLSFGGATLVTASYYDQIW